MKSTTSTLAASLLAATAATLFASAATAADFPAGTYAASGITLTFDGKGHFRGTQKDAVVVEGDYHVKGDQLELADKSGPWACPAAQTGTYAWKPQGETLTFNKVADGLRRARPEPDDAFVAETELEIMSGVPTSLLCSSRPTSAASPVSKR